MRSAAAVVIAVAAAVVLAACTVEIADQGEGAATTKGATQTASALSSAIVGTWQPTTLDGRDVVPEVDNLGVWTFTDTTLRSGTAESGCEQRYTLGDTSSDGMKADLTRDGPATWTGDLAANPDPPDCPFGFNMPAEVTIVGGTLTVTEGAYDPPASGGTDHEPKTIAFARVP